MLCLTISPETALSIICSLGKWGSIGAFAPPAPIKSTMTTIITVYIHFESIYCIWMVSLFDWQSIAKAGQSIAKHFSKWRMEQAQ